jgi:4-amino-4-deoxy-L-arabinose transferase-like glycosyltransferase
VAAIRMTHSPQTADKSGDFARLPIAPLMLAVVLILAAAALRLHDLGAQSLWYDEGNSYVQSLRTLGEIADNAARDIHPPGYYWLLAGWRLLTGESEFALRSLSAFASILTVALTFAAGRRLSGVVGGGIAAALVALNTFSIYYAQESRMYALLALWGTASLYALIRLSERPTRARLIVLGLINAAGLWTHYAFPFFMIAQGVIVLVSARERGTIRRMVTFTAANLIAIAMFAAWLPTALGQLTTWTQVRDAVPLSESLPTLFRWLTFGIAAVENAPALVWIVLAFGTLTLRRTPGESRIAPIVPLAWTIIPVGVFLAFGLYREANLKFLLPAQVGVALWLARGVVNLAALGTAIPRARAVTRLAALGTFAWLCAAWWSGVPALYTDPRYQRPDYRALTAAITASARADDAIILNAPNQIEVFRYYYAGDLPIYPLPTGLGGGDPATQAATRAEVERIIAAHGRAFAVFYGEMERDPARIVETTLDARAFELGDTWYGDVRLARYALPAPLDFVRQSGARFGEAITLTAYALSDGLINRASPMPAVTDARIRAAPDDAIQLQLTWTTEAPLTTRYKVFVQLLDADGVLVAQRDSEPGGGLALTSTWTPNEPITDNHALIVPADAAGTYTLIVGLYDVNDPAARLPVGDADHLVLARVVVDPHGG